MLQFILQLRQSLEYRLAFLSLFLVSDTDLADGTVHIVNGSCLQSSGPDIIGSSNANHNDWPAVFSRDVSKGGFVRGAIWRCWPNRICHHSYG